MNDKQPSVFGGACIIASVCVGAGMLGLPSAGAGAWTLWTCLAMLVTMMVMTLSGWMLLEAYKRYDIRVSFDTVTHDMFGSGANTINNIAVYFVGGILLYAYITTAGMILPPLIGLNSKLSSILFVIVFGAFVWHSTRAVDRISVVLIIFMVLSFIFSIFGLAKNINLPMLFDSGSKHPSYAPYALAMFPVALASFGYHHSAASMRAYYGEERKASRAILGGTLITLAFYVVWIVSIFGNLPREQFAPVIKAGGDLDVLLPALSSVIHSENVNHAIRAFAMAAILSSFIGVGLGVFDFLADFFKFKNDAAGRTKSWLATFPAAAGAVARLPHRLPYRHRLRGRGGDHLDVHHARAPRARIPPPWARRLHHAGWDVHGVVRFLLWHRRRRAAHPEHDGQTAGLYRLKVRPDSKKAANAAFLLFCSRLDVLRHP